MMSYKGRGIVLHTIKYGDSAAVAYLLTDVLGRQNYMVQGIRSSRGHGNKGALLQPMFLVEFEGLEGVKGSELHRFREIRSAEVLRTIPFDVRRGTVSLFMAELLYRLVKEQEPNSGLFDFVWRAVLELDMAEGAGVPGGVSVADFHLWFMVQLAGYLGFAPSGEWTSGGWFDIAEGCFTSVRPLGGLFFSPENARLLWEFMNGGGAGLNRLRRVEFLNAMLAYFGYHLDAVRDIRSVEILREVF